MAEQDANSSGAAGGTARVDVQIQRRQGAEPVRTDRPPRHAVVIGGGLAGVLAAHVLTVYADRITLVERDTYPKEPVRRDGAPGGDHAQLLLPAGRAALEKLLPGFTAELEQQGAARIGDPVDVVQWQAGNWQRRTEATRELIAASRPLVEQQLRRRVLGTRQIEVLEGTEAVGLIGDAARIRGVLVRSAEEADGQTRILDADLVIDASGRDTRAPEWLASLGAEPPREETIDAGVILASRTFRPKDGGPEGFRAIRHGMDAAQPRGAVLLPAGGGDGAWTATLAGLRGDEPPTDDAGFVSFTAGLLDPIVHEQLRDAEPVTPVRLDRRTGNVLRRYDREGRRPAGFLAIGGALVSLNPLHGQGASVAALQAVALRDALAGLTKVPTTARVQKALAAAGATAWGVAAGTDRTLPTSGAAAGPVERPVRWYLDRVVERAATDPVVGAAYRDVSGLLARPASLLHPRVARAVLLRGSASSHTDTVAPRRAE